MPEFKQKPLAKADMRSIRMAGVSNVADPSTAALANTIGQFSEGAAKGYAQGQGEALQGDAATATADIEKAFSPVKDAVNEGVSKDDVAALKQEAIDSTANSFARIKAAVDQGIMSSSAGNMRMQALRKEKLSNPITAMFQKDFDASFASVTGAGARGAFFGKTQAEKNEEARQTSLNDAVVKKETAIAQLVSNGLAASPEVATTMYNQAQASAFRVTELTKKKDLELLGAGEAVELYNLEAQKVNAGVAQAVVGFVNGQGTAEEKAAFDETMAKTHAQERFRITSSTMTQPAKDKAMERLDAQMTAAKKAAEDTTYTSQVQAANTQVTAVMQQRGLVVLSDMMANNPVLQKAYALSGNNPAGLGPILEIIYSSDSLMKQMQIATDPLLGEVFQGDEAGNQEVVRTAFSALTGGGEGDGPAKKMSGVVMQQKGMPSQILAAYAKDPEATAKGLATSQNVNLKNINNNNEWKSVLRKQPELLDPLIQAAGSEAKNISMASSGNVPSTLSFQLTSAANFGNQQRPATWKFQSGGVPISDKYKEQVVNAYRMAQGNPGVWQNEFDTAEEYVASRFTLPRDSSQAPVPPVEEPAKATPAAKIDAGDKAVMDAIEAAEFTPEQRRKVADVLGNSFLGKLFSGEAESSLPGVSKLGASEMGPADVVFANLRRMEGTGDNLTDVPTGDLGVTDAARRAVGGEGKSDKEVAREYLELLQDKWDKQEGYQDAPDAVKEMLLDSTYNMGESVLRFKGLKTALANKDYQQVGKELLDTSNVDGQSVKGLARRRAEMFNDIADNPVAEILQDEDGKITYFDVDGEVIFSYTPRKGKHPGSVAGRMRIER